MSEPSLILVHLGARLPAWLGTMIGQVRTFSSCRIVLLAEAGALRNSRLPGVPAPECIATEELGVSAKQREFRRLSPLDRSFRAGFWTYTSERFFVIEWAMEKLGLTQVLHAENDVMLYCCVNELVARLAQLYRGIAATFDNDARCVPGIVYFPERAAAAALTDFYLQLLAQLAAAPRPDVVVNDMQVLGALRMLGPAVADHLPVVPPDYPGPLRSALGHRVLDAGSYSRHFEALGLLFDAAALGQFLGGIDPRNPGDASAGFVNESCVFDPRLLHPRMVRDAAGRRVPVVQTASGVHRVANLHVHSKNLEAFRSL